MSRKFTQAVVALALVCVIGGPWAMLQSFAWLGMAVTYAQDASLKEAFVKTFDGKHPCGICKAVQEGKRSERKQNSLKLDTKIDLWLVRAAAWVSPTLPSFNVRRTPVSCVQRVDSPPTPPPRLQLA